MSKKSEISDMIKSHVQYINIWIAFWLIVYADTIVISIYKFVSSIKLDIPKLSERKKNIPLSDRLRNFLQEHAGFPVQKAIQEFGLSTRQVKSIGDVLEQEGILTRGDSNARILKTTKIQSPDGSYTIIQPDMTKVADVLDKTIAKA